MLAFMAISLLQVEAGVAAPCSNPTCTSPPCAATLTGDVGCTTVSGTPQYTHEIQPSTIASTAHIYGPFEAGFTSMQNSIIQGWGCTTPSVVYDPTGGMDLKIAEEKVANACALSNFPAASGSSYTGIVSYCGGHTNDYHFHVRLECLYTTAAGSGHSTKVGNVAQYSLYGKHEDYANSKLPLLDACGAHFGTNPDSTATDVYHYHVQDYPPFTVGCHGPASGSTKMTVSGCRALYTSSNGCGSTTESITIKQRSTPNGPANGATATVSYDRWCPCWDANRQNTATNIVELPAIACGVNWYSGAWSSTACGSGCTVPSTAGYNFGSAGGTTTISGFSPSGVVCASGFSGTVTYTVCSSSGTAYSVSGCTASPSCTVPSTAGYTFSSAGGTTTISGFSPSGVVCASGFSGTVTYTVCSSSGTAYSVSGCAAGGSTSSSFQSVPRSLHMCWLFISLQLLTPVCS